MTVVGERARDESDPSGDEARREDADEGIRAQGVSAFPRGLRAQGRPIVLRPLSLGGPAAEEASRALRKQLEACHILFLGPSLQSSWPRIRSLLGRRAIVTVSEIDGFSHDRGMIEFVVSASDRTVAMHIDLTAVRDVGLRLSSRLLGLKRGVVIVRGARDSTAHTRDGRSSG